MTKAGGFEVPLPVKTLKPTPRPRPCTHRHTYTQITRTHFSTASGGGPYNGLLVALLLMSDCPVFCNTLEEYGKVQ